MILLKPSRAFTGSPLAAGMAGLQAVLATLLMLAGAPGLAAGMAGTDGAPPAGATGNVQYLAATCANCHGTGGQSRVEKGFPLAGMNEAYLTEQMQAFKSGQRSATVMHQIARGYSDEQVRSLARFFAAQGRQ